MLVNVYGTIQCCERITLARWDWNLSVPLCPSSLPRTLFDCTLEKYCLPTDVLVLSIILRNFILASIQLLDVNEVVNFIKKINIML
jgi:hypothetical protein